MSTATIATKPFRTFGPDLNVIFFEGPDPEAPPAGTPTPGAVAPSKPLFAVDFKGVTGKGTPSIPVVASFGLPVSNPATNANLLNLMVATLPVLDAGGNAIARPDTPDGWVNHPLAKVFSTDTSTKHDGGQVDVTIAGLPHGNFAARSILEWASD